MHVKLCNGERLTSLETPFNLKLFFSAGNYAHTMVNCILNDFSFNVKGHSTTQLSKVCPKYHTNGTSGAGMELQSSWLQHQCTTDFTAKYKLLEIRLILSLGEKICFLQSSVVIPIWNNCLHFCLPVEVCHTEHWREDVHLSCSIAKLIPGEHLKPFSWGRRKTNKMQSHKFLWKSYISISLLSELAVD